MRLILLTTSPTVGFFILIEILSQLGYPVPDPGILGLTGVLIATRWGGVVSGVLSVFVVLAYSLYHSTHNAEVSASIHAWHDMGIIFLGVSCFMVLVLVHGLASRSEAMRSMLESLALENETLKEKDFVQSVQLSVAQAIAEGGRNEEVIQRILKNLGQSSGWDVGDFWKLDPVSQVLRCEVSWHSPRLDSREFEAVSRSFTFKKGAGIPGRVWQTGDPTWIPDVTIDENFPRKSAASRRSLHAAYALPLQSGPHFVGVIEFLSREIRQPDPRVLRLSEEWGALIANFVVAQNGAAASATRGESRKVPV